jgi:type I restriction enzyme S subunit
MSGLTTGPIKNFVLGIYDGPHATPAESADGPIFLGIKNVTPDGTLDFSEIKHVSEQDYLKWTKRVVPRKDDIVFSYEATLHRYAIIPEGFRGCLGRRMALVRPDPSKLNSRFLHYYFLTPTWRSVIDSNTITGATVDRIPLVNFPNFKIHLPSLSVQLEIASTLGAYDDLIENNRRRIQLLEESARLLYREWFVNLRFPGHEHVKITDGVPEGWKLGNTADFGHIVTGKTPSTKDSDNFGGDIPFIKTPDMHGNAIIVKANEYLSEKGANSQGNKFIPEGTIMVSCIGTVGVVSMTMSKCQTNQQINSVIPKQKELQYYIYFALRDLKPRLEAIGGGVTMANVNKAKFASVPVLLPGSSLVTMFYEFSHPIFSQIKSLLLANEKLREARDLLLPRLMNGEIAV